MDEQQAGEDEVSRRGCVGASDRSQSAEQLSELRGGVPTASLDEYAVTQYLELILQLH